MKTVSLSGSLRENVGKKDAKSHRKEGRVPCVIYGGKEQIHFTIEEKAFKPIIFTPSVYLLIINVSGTEHNAILQDIQYHPVTDAIIHADFLETIPGKAVTIGMPVVYEGNAPGLLLGGKLRKKIKRIKVKGLVEDFPEDFLLDISGLEINDAIRVRDIKDDKLEFLDNPNSVIVSVQTARGAGMDEEEEEEEEEGEEGAEGAATEEKAEGGE